MAERIPFDIKYVTGIYSDDDYDRDPKELFKFIGDHVAQLPQRPESILDVGCAKGEFIYYLKRRFGDPEVDFHGIDLCHELIARAQAFEGLRGVSFHETDTPCWKINQVFDCITAIGVLTYYDNFQYFIDTLLDHLSDSGTIFIANGFTASDYDVIIRYRHWSKPNMSEAGWNQFSLVGIRHYLSTRGYGLVAHQFKMPFPLKRQGDLIRSWTIETDEGRKFTNGMNLIWDLWCLEIRKGI